MEVDHTSEIIQASVYKAHQRQRRNASLPSTSLPPEILSFIFELVRDRYTWFDPGKYDSWIPAVTHVCAAWREVALQTPQLWTFASLYPLEWGNEVLRRAKGAPLDVSVCGKLFGDDLNSMNEGISLMKAAFSELDRVRSIDLSLPAQQPDTVLKTLSELVCPSFMPLLESIAIQSPFRACRVLDGTFVTDDSAPRLKRLILGDCLLDLSTPRFKRLCYLELESTLSPATRITDLRSFCIALGEMHDLVELKLSDVIAEHVDEDTLQAMIFNPIQLPSLRRIEVLETCVPLPIFRCTRAPRLVYAYISLYDFLGYEDVSDNLEEIYKFAAFGTSV
ncbi:hypothetical protein ONZ45_g16580 [Pleurotus djamor]|nr:hypothetical protein ONZ45_g16580 [Pleurotus djamor]